MTSSAKHRRMSRREKAEATYARLMDAAAAVVGREGYAAASVAKITASSSALSYPAISPRATARSSARR